MLGVLNDGQPDLRNEMMDGTAAATATVAALREIGRDDLAQLVQFFEDDDGSVYLEPMDDVDAADLALMLKAEALALSKGGVMVKLR